MARKYDLISELYNRTCKTVVSNPQNWQAFLASACRNYKLRYDEQLLVYAQRPDATAVLEIEQWNRIFGRWVNRGARGIAVFADENRTRQRLTHYFDISDTHESRYSRTVPIWDMRQEYEADVIETLESTFGEIENKSSLAEAIMGAARNAAEDNIPDYLQDLYYATEGSFLEEVDNDIVASIYKNVVANSVAYMMMSRLGVDTDGYFELDDFRDVTNFNTQETLNALGFATSDIAEMGLTEVSKTITALNRQNRIIVGQDRNEYNKVENNDERSLDNERTDLHNGGRLQPSEPETSTAAGSDFGQIRSDEEKVSEGTSQSPLLQSPDEGRTDTALGGSGTESQQDGRNNPEPDGTERGSDRTDESRGYDEMGSSDERSSQLGTGNRESGSDIRLEYYDRTHEDKSLPFFGRDEVINEILRTTPHLSASLEEIKDYYERNLDNKDRTEYIKSIFNNDYTELTLAELTDMNRNLMMSIDIVPVPTDEAVKEAENRLLGVETNITNWQRRQNANNNFSATVPYDMEQQKKEMKEFLDDLTTRDQRMMFAVITMVITADSKEQLENDTEALLTTARKHLCQFATLRFQQVDGLNTVMPFGTRKIDAFRTLTTESLSVFIPFRVQDIFHENGIYYGQNVISKNMIIADRKQLLNGNSFILGVSGGGKSFAAKGEIINQVLSSDADIIIIDPEREYSQLVNAMGGEVINISATSDNHINAMDMNKDYGDGANPVILKSEFIMSLCEQLIGGTNLGAKQKSIIDRCTASVYRSYQQNDYQGHIPTLQDFRAELLQQDEPEAKELALAIELFTHGSLNTFAKQTNVDTNNRLICYDILDLGKQLMPIGMLVVLDSILNRITQNRAKGKNTFIFIDEIYLLFQHEYSANFLFTLWKRVRKYGAYASGITQNVDDLLQSHTARTMLANSEFIIMLNQASTDRLELAKLLNISDLQMSYITNVEAGHGLIKVGSSLVPFANKFPKNTKLYKLMTTKPGEA